MGLPLSRGIWRRRALAQPSVIRPGDTIWVRGGTYRGGFTSSLIGTSSAPIIVRQYPGERATIDGNLVINGSDTWYWGFEVINSNPASPNTNGIDDHGPRTRLINLVVHDVAGVGIGFWSEAPDAEMFGCLSYNNGRETSTPTPYAHGVYTQNQTGTKKLFDNIVFNNFGYNFHAYTEGGALNNFDVEGNTSFNSGAWVSQGGWEYLFGGYQALVNLTFSNNYSYRPNRTGHTYIGYNVSNPAGSRVINNYLAGSTTFINWQGLTVTGNTFTDVPTPALSLSVSSAPSLTNFSWDNNVYWSASATPFALTVAGTSQTYSLTGWTAATGFDRAATLNQGSLTGTKVVVRPNQYEAGRANVIIYNYDNLAAVSVDLSSVLASGQAYEVRNVQDFFGAPVVTGNYAGGAVAFPMTAVTPATPQGATLPALLTGPRFNVFVVLPR